jgi:hypothetical protein
MRRLLLIAAAAAGAAAIGFYYKVLPWWKSWGVDAAEAEMPLAGDDIVAEPTVIDTRGITIDAPPSAIWPWLVQMGYGRGGWYSYDQLDMRGKSATTIEPEWQALAEGDTVPLSPAGGFVAKTIEHEKALVLYLDNEIIESLQQSDDGEVESPTRGLAFAGAMGERSMPGTFRFSWAFVLRPTEDGRTRFLERIRVELDQATPGSRMASPIMGFGVFAMMQRQMVGIRDRAEKLARERGVPAIAAEVGEPVMADTEAAEASDPSQSSEATQETPA